MEDRSFAPPQVHSAPSRKPSRYSAASTAATRTFVLIVGLLSFVHAQQPGTLQERRGDTLTIEVSNLRGTRGTVRASVWSSTQAFMKDKPVAYAYAKVSGPTVVLQIEHLAHGTYAVATFQDENDNGQLDSGGMGIPKEPYGFSGKSRSLFGPPTFRNASFSFPEEATISIRLKY